MNITRFQKIAFIVIAVSLFLGPLVSNPGIFTYLALAGATLYLLLGWYMPLIRKDKNFLTHEIAGFIYSTVMIASVLEQYLIPGAKYFTLFGEALALGLVIYMTVKRKEVDRYQLGQAVVLLLLSPVPLLAGALSS